MNQRPIPPPSSPKYTNNLRNSTWGRAEEDLLQIGSRRKMGDLNSDFSFIKKTAETGYCLSHTVFIFQSDGLQKFWAHNKNKLFLLSCLSHTLFISFIKKQNKSCSGFDNYTFFLLKDYSASQTKSFLGSH